MSLSNKPYKGTKDLRGYDLQVLQYIFNTWRKVCLSYGYKEYLTPTIELADIYRAKSGEVKDELFTLRDRADRDLALRPEMTPSVTRLVTQLYKEEPKPIRLFSIANFFRNEAPQKGRYREFWQLNFDIFGVDSVYADIEIMTLMIEIMLAFNAPKDSFILYFSNRKLIDAFMEEILELNDEITISTVARAMDRSNKLSESELTLQLTDCGLDKKQIDAVKSFLQTNADNFTNSFPTLVDTQAFNDIKIAQDKLAELGYTGMFEFSPSVIRGFDYYDGMVFEIFDLSPENNRSLFGGGRYNGLAEIFGEEPFPATGVAPGNVTTQLFLENWNLVPELEYKMTYCPLLSEKLRSNTLSVCNQLRQKGFMIENDLDVKSVGEALRYANKRGFEKVIILGENEFKDNQITVKNLKSGEQETKSLELYLSEIL